MRRQPHTIPEGSQRLSAGGHGGTPPIYTKSAWGKGPPSTLKLKVIFLVAVGDIFFTLCVTLWQGQRDKGAVGTGYEEWGKSSIFVPGYRTGTNILLLDRLCAKGTQIDGRPHSSYPVLQPLSLTLPQCVALRAKSYILTPRVAKDDIEDAVRTLCGREVAAGLGHWGWRGHIRSRRVASLHGVNKEMTQPK